MNKAVQELNPLLSEGWCGASKHYYRRNINEATALHRLVGQRVRADAVKIFLDLHARNTDDNCTKLSHHQMPTSGATALHVALHRCSWGVLEIVHLLVSAIPQLPSIPMHSTNVYPLHLVCYHYGKLLLSDSDKYQLFCMILEAWPQAATERDSDGDTPLELLFYYDDQQNPRSLVRAALRLARVSVFCDRDNIDLTWYHLCSLPKFPSGLMVELLTLYKDTNFTGVLGGFTGQRDPATGRTPLHASAAAESSSRPGRSLVQVVLQADPTAVILRDHQGRLPLHDAVVNPTLKRSDIMSLAQAHAEALTVLDPITGLWPFLSLATHHCGLNIAYDLLRMDPTICRC